MVRMPTPGGDQGQWGAILNDFLSVEHNADGSLKKATDIAAKYEKPGSGIPAGDLSSATQASLTKADSSVQSVNAVFPTSGNVTLTATDISAIPASQKGVANGVASLGSDGKVPTGQLPNGILTSSDLTAIRPSAYAITSPLATGEVFVSEVLDLKGADTAFRIDVSADQSFTLKVEHSGDGVAWATLRQFVAATIQGFAGLSDRRYMRLTLTNTSGSNQARIDGVVSWTPVSVVA